MMINRFNEWDSNNIRSINEDAKSSTLGVVAKQTGRTIDDLVKTGFKGVGSLFRKLFGASADEISKFDKGLSDVVNIQRNTWWQSLSKDARKTLEKDGDEVVKKYVTAYNSGDQKLIASARNSSAEYLKKVERIGVEQKAIDDLTSNIDELPTRRLRNQLTDGIKDAQQSIDDAAKSGDLDKLAAARKSAQSLDDFFKEAGRKSVYPKSQTRFYGRRGVLGRGLEPGADLAEDATSGLASKGKDGFIKTLRKEVADEGKSNIDDLRGNRSNPTKAGGGIWNSFKRNLKRLFVLSATIYSGGVIWNYIKDGKQEEAIESFSDSLEKMKKKFIEEGVSLSNINMNKASFSDVFSLFFAGTSKDLPVDDAKELDTMLKANSTMTDFFAKTVQLCFEYTEKYFKENKDKMKSTSSFYGFIHQLEKKIGIPKIISAVGQAEGLASQAIEETFYENGSPISLDEYGYASFSNPNMKILLGSNEPVNMQSLLDESKDFISMFSLFKRKIMNDFIQGEITNALKEDGTITQEEFEERARRMERELSEQLTEKEESFVAMTGLILSYNIDRKPFKQLYGFDDNSLYSTVDSINTIIDQDFDLRSNRQLSRMYLSLSSGMEGIYKDMGKERTLYGVMEYSTLGNVMRSIMNLYVLEDICKIMLSSKASDFERSFTKSEIEEYQKVINQIQRKEGIEPTVVASGKMDDETTEAIKLYQKKLGLPVTGVPGEKSLVKMKDYLVSMITSKQD